MEFMTTGRGEPKLLNRQCLQEIVVTLIGNARKEGVTMDVELELLLISANHVINKVIKKADKGSCLVVWDRNDCIAEAGKQLNN